MNKKTTRLRCLLTALLLVVAMLMPIPASAAITPVEPTTGDGTSENPYQITTAAELYGLGWNRMRCKDLIIRGKRKKPVFCGVQEKLTFIIL